MTRQLLPWTIAGSLLLHGVAYTALGAPRAPASAQHRQTLVRFEVAARPEQQLSPAPPEPKPAPPKPRPPKQNQAAPVPRNEPEAPRSLPSTPEAPVSSGTALAADNASNAFSMPLGNGGALDPTAAPVAARLNPPASSPSPTPAPVRSVSAVPVVPAGDLSARPTPPALGAVLERNYPADARRRGLSGTAKVRARIDPDGVVRHVTLLDESDAGFGGACSRTLTGSRWAAPKDKAGRSVATEIRYTCRFVVQP